MFIFDHGSNSRRVCSYGKRFVTQVRTQQNLKFIALALFLSFSLSAQYGSAESTYHAKPGNFGLPGIMDLPTAKRFSDGEYL